MRIAAMGSVGDRSAALKSARELEHPPRSDFSQRFVTAAGPAQYAGSIKCKSKELNLLGNLSKSLSDGVHGGITDAL